MKSKLGKHVDWTYHKKGPLGFNAERARPLYDIRRRLRNPFSG